MYVCMYVCVSQVKELNALQLKGLSVREKNKAKRKARQLARRVSIDADSVNRRCVP